MDILYDSDVVVSITFILFFGLLAYFGVHKLIIKGLDDRAARIRGELDEARALREEAQATFAEFERKQKEVAAQAEDIVAHAKTEAQQAAEQAKADLRESIARRLKAADEQIALAEANAVKEVRDKAVQIAIAAASEVMQAKMTGEKADAMVEDAIRQVGTRLN